MVSVVPAAGKAAAMTPPRVMPKVFADVPSQMELERANRAKKAMRGWVLLLVVLLVAAGGLIAWEVVVGRPAIAEGVSKSKKDLDDANKKLVTADAELQKQAKNYEKLSVLYQPFQAIAQSEGEIADLKSQIQTRLGQYPAARDRTLIDYKDNWKAYDSAGVWKGVNKTEVGQD